MLELAQKYAATLKTSVIAHRFEDNGKTIVFVLEAGPKLRMTEAELNTALNPKSEEPTPQAEQVETKKKGKSK